MGRNCNELEGAFPVNILRTARRRCLAVRCVYGERARTGKPPVPCAEIDRNGQLDRKTTADSARNAYIGRNRREVFPSSRRNIAARERTDGEIPVRGSIGALQGSGYGTGARGSRRGGGSEQGRLCEGRGTVGGGANAAGTRIQGPGVNERKRGRRGKRGVSAGKVRGKCGKAGESAV